MWITIDNLRRIIKEEIERNLRWSAGMFGGVGGRSRKGSMLPPPGLGNEKEIEKDVKEKEEQRFTQVGPRVERRKRKRNGTSWSN